MPFQNLSSLQPDVINGIPPNLYTPIGTILAAFIGGTISFLALVISKENEVSKFRQAWIDGLRGDIAKFLASTEALAVITDKYYKESLKADASNIENEYVESGSIPSQPAEPGTDISKGDPSKVEGDKTNRKSYYNFLNDVKVLHSDMLVNYRSLMLRLSSETHITLATVVEELYSEFHKYPLSTKAIRGIANTLVVVARKVLDTEWKKVKKGEKTFSLVKGVSAALVLTMFIYIIRLLINSGFFSNLLS